MPTTRKRHMVTETDRVQKALAPLRSAGQKVDLGELVVLGAERKLATLTEQQLDDARRLELREQFLEITRSGAGFDLDAAFEVREQGWARD